MASIYFANRYPDAKIVAIEPESSNAAILTANCKPYPNITVLEKAVSYKSGAMKIVDTGSGHYGFMMKEIDGSENTNTPTIETVTLGEVMKMYAMDNIDLLKMDVEGSEREIFSYKSEEWLPKTRALTVELHDRFVPGASKAVIKAVARYDFSVYGSPEGFFCVQDS